jgi:predicted RNA-binding protein YlqC (UPF0109 family)
MENSYYNTNREKGETLINSNVKAKSQEEEVLSIFKERVRLSASEAWKIYAKQGTPITSIRRAITNLCKDYKLVKTEETTEGIYGKKEHVYTLLKTSNQLTIF